MMKQLKREYRTLIRRKAEQREIKTNNGFHVVKNRQAPLVALPMLHNGDAPSRAV